MKSQHVDLTPLRTHFPALQATDPQGRPYVYFDGPGGTQVPQTVIDAMADYFRSANANAGGQYVTSRRNDAMIEAARSTMADFLNAPAAHEIVFGPNMTSLTFNLSRSIADDLQSGDEIVVTRLDHDANISPGWPCSPGASGSNGPILITATAVWTSTTWHPLWARAPNWWRWGTPPTPWAPSIPSRRSLPWPMRRAPGCGWMRCSTLPTAPSTYRIWDAIFWSVRPTNSSDPMWASCGAGGNIWSALRPIR